MKINAQSTKKIIELQASMGISDNKLLLFALSLDLSKGTVIKTVLNELVFSEEEVISFVKIFQELDLLTKKDQELVERLNKIKVIDIENFEHEIEEVIAHLNSLTNSNRKITPKRKLLVEQWLRRGYTLDQFKMVNLYFHNRWGKDIKMADYLVAETLYNTKFPTRVDDSEYAFKNILKFKEQIANICETYYEIFNKIVNHTENQFSEIGQKNMCSYLPFDLQKRIAFWLVNGFNEEQLKMTIEQTIISWSTKEELIPYINLVKILDSKFPDRVLVANKIQNALPVKSGVIAANNWLEENS